MFAKRLAALLLALAAIAPAAAEEAEAPALAGFRAEYELIRDDKPAGEAVYRLHATEPGHWTLSNQTRGTHGMAAFVGFRLDESASLVWVDGHFASDGYQYLQKAAFSKRTRSLEIDRAGQTATSIDGKKRYAIEYRPDLLDRQSVGIVLAHDLASGHRDVLIYPVAGRRALSRRVFEVVGEETLQTPAGEFATLKVARIREDEEKRETITWFAREGHLFPIQVEQSEEDGEHIVLRLRAYRLEP